MSDIAAVLDKGLQFLSERQLPSGQFPIEVTFCKRDDKAPQPDEVLFASAHIVYSLADIPDPRAQAMISRTLAYFLREMSGPGLWRYWNKGAKRSGRELYSFIPPDLDDMATISYLLRAHNIPYPDNRRLFLCNRNRRGSFYTWMVLRPAIGKGLHYWRTLLFDITLPRYTVFFTTTDAEYNDVDSVVNANVLLYLGERVETKPVIDWLIEIVKQGNESRSDKWYRDPFTFYYALSRCFKAGITSFAAVKDIIVSRLEAFSHGGRIGENELHTALAANTLLNFGEHGDLLKRAVNWLLGAQSERGSWPSAPFYYSGPRMLNSWGADELTTAISLEALYRYQAHARIADGTDLGSD